MGWGVCVSLWQLGLCVCYGRSTPGILVAFGVRDLAYLSLYQPDLPAKEGQCRSSSTGVGTGQLVWHVTARVRHRAVDANKCIEPLEQGNVVKHMDLVAAWGSYTRRKRGNQGLVAGVTILAYSLATKLAFRGGSLHLTAGRVLRAVPTGNGVDRSVLVACPRPSPSSLLDALETEGCGETGSSSDVARFQLLFEPRLGQPPR